MFKKLKSGLLITAVLAGGASGFWFAMQADPVDALRARILQLRPPPLTNMNTGVRLHVTDFGAVPDDGLDDRAAVAAAITSAKILQGPMRIDFFQRHAANGRRLPESRRTSNPLVCSKLALVSRADRVGGRTLLDHGTGKGGNRTGKRRNGVQIIGRGAGTAAGLQAGV